MKSDKILKRSFCILIVTILFIAFIPHVEGESADISDISLVINTDFELIEYSLKRGHKENVSSINILLPSNTWNIDNIELNFDEMEFGTEEKIIEDVAIDSVVIDKFNDGYGVQIEMIDSTIIYGIEIYGYNKSTKNTPIFIQISGYDNSTNSPNATLFGSIKLNMPYSDNPSWHLQNFSNPIYLTKGDYYLIFDGSSIGNSPKSDYYWYFNDINPLNPDLYVSKYDSGSWLDGSQGAPFLHKIIQKVNASFFPEEINMTAQIDGNHYEIEDGPHRGKGYLKKNENITEKASYTYALFRFSGKNIFKIAERCKKQGLLLRPTWPTRQKLWNHQDTEVVNKFGEEILTWVINPMVSKKEIEKFIRIMGRLS